MKIFGTLLVLLTFHATASTAAKNEAIYLKYANGFVKTCDANLPKAKKKQILSRYVNYARTELKHQDRFIPDTVMTFANKHLNTVQRQINQGDFSSSRTQAAWLSRVFRLVNGGNNE